MKRIIAAVSLLIAACQETPSTAVAAASVGLAIGSGTHAGVIQEARGTRVEVVPFSDGSIRAYITDASGQPIQATATVTANITAPDFSPTEVALVPAENGAFLVGKLSGPAPKTPAQIDLVFPEGVKLSYASVPLVAEAIVTAPALAVVTPEAPAVTIVPADFVPPHKGTVTRVGDNIVEVVIAPKGEVQAYVYELDGDPIPPAEVTIPAVDIVYESKPYNVKLAPAKGDVYFVGRVDAKLTIPAQAKIEIDCPQPVIIRGVTYQPDIIVFAAPYIVYEPVVFTPIVVTGPNVVVDGPDVVVGAPGVVVTTPGIVVRPPSLVVVPPRVNVGVNVGIGVGVGVKYSGKHSHKHSHKHKKKHKYSD